tara:strand:- start:83 stop:640 length:558 start_codon:yes stop_codon:yes gene_type:complete
MTRKLSLKAIQSVVDKLELNPANVLVDLEESEFCDSIFGVLSRGNSLSNDDVEEALILSVPTCTIRDVLGGVSGMFLKSGNVPGVELLGDGTCNIDPFARVFAINEISIEDIKNGVQRMYRSAEAAEVVHQQNPSIEKSNIGERLPSKAPARQKYGSKLWLWNKEYIDGLTFSPSAQRLKIVESG